MLPHIPNFRQLAGTKLYRSSKPDRMTEGDLEIVRNQLGVKTIIDLRGKIECSERILCDNYYTKYFCGDGRFDENVKRCGGELSVLGKQQKDCELGQQENRRYVVGVLDLKFILKCLGCCSFYQRFLFYFLAIVDKCLGTTYSGTYFSRAVHHGRPLLKQYERIIRFCGEGKLSTVLRMLSKPENMPAIICCALGKDRTGLVCALVHSLTGKSKQFIAEDYAKSEEGLRPIQSELVADVKKMMVDEDFLSAKYETMADCLDNINLRHGSVSDYLTSVGFGISEQAALRNNIIL